MVLLNLADDISLEILCGTDRFDKSDIDYVIEANDIDRVELANEVRRKLEKHDSTEFLSGDKESSIN